MARPDKVAVVERVSERLIDANATLLTDYRGLSVTELAELRAELRKVDATYAVVKNTLTRLAAADSGMEGLDEMLVGPTALVFCGEDPVGPAKALKKFAEEHEQLIVKGGYFEGGVLDAEAAMKLADLASREELLATLAGMMDNALAGFARLLQAPIVEMARLAAALEADGGVEAKGFSPEPAADAPQQEAEAVEDAPADDVAEEVADASSASSDSSDSEDSADSVDSDDSDDSPAADADADEADADEADADDADDGADDGAADDDADDDDADDSPDDDDADDDDADDDADDSPDDDADDADDDED